MSERYQIIIKAGENSFHFKSKTRVGEFWNFSEEMKEHVDWEQMAIELDKRTKEVLDSVSCPKCKSSTQETFMEGQYLVPSSDRDAIIKACTKCDWLEIERL